MTQTELIQALNEVRKITKGMSARDLELVRLQVSNDLKLARLGIK